MKSLIPIICLSLVLVATRAHNTSNSAVRTHHVHNVHSSNRHHHKSHQLKHQGVQHPFHQTYRDAPQQHCRYVCTSEPSNSSSTPVSGLQIIFNGKNSLIAIVNSASNVALIIDYSANVAVIFNGQSGTTLVYDELSQQLYRLPTNPSTASLIWQPSKEPFDVYFQHLTSLGELQKLAQQSGQKIDPTSSPELEQALGNLGGGLSSQEALGLITRFTELMRGPLKLLFGANGSITSPHDLRWFISVSIAASDLLSLADGGLTAGIDPEALYRASSGIEGLVKLLAQIGQHVDLGRAFSRLWQSPDRVAQLFGQASTGSHNGLDGLVSILISIWETMRGQAPINALITNILNYNASAAGGDETSLSDLSKEILQVFEAQNRQFNNNQVFAWYERVLRALIDSNLVLNGVNVSDIVKILTAPNPLDRISTIVRILSLFNPVRAIPQFFKFVTGLLNSTDSNGLLSRLLPGVDFSNFTGPETIFQNILHGQNFSSIIANPWNATAALSQIPIFGTIFQRFTSYLGNDFNINRILGEFQNILTGSGNNSLSNNGSSSSLPAQIEQGFSHFASGVEHGIEGILGGNGGGSSNQTQSPSNPSEPGQPGGSQGGSGNCSTDHSQGTPNSSPSGAIGSSGEANSGGAGGSTSGGAEGSSSGGNGGSESGGAGGLTSGGGLSSGGSGGTNSGGAGGLTSGGGSSSGGSGGSESGGAGGLTSGGSLSSGGSGGSNSGGAGGLTSGGGWSSGGSGGSNSGGAGGLTFGGGSSSGESGGSNSGGAGGLTSGGGLISGGSGESNPGGSGGGSSSGVGGSSGSSNSGGIGELNSNGAGGLTPGGWTSGGGAGGLNSGGAGGLTTGGAGGLSSLGASAGSGSKGSEGGPSSGGAGGLGSEGAGGLSSGSSGGSNSGGLSGGTAGVSSIGGAGGGSSTGGHGGFGSGESGGLGSEGHAGLSGKKAAKGHHHKPAEKRKHVKQTV